MKRRRSRKKSRKRSSTGNRRSTSNMKTKGRNGDGVKGGEKGGKEG